MSLSLLQIDQLLMPVLMLLNLLQRFSRQMLLGFSPVSGLTAVLGPGLRMSIKKSEQAAVLQRQVSRILFIGLFSLPKVCKQVGSLQGRNHLHVLPSGRLGGHIGPSLHKDLLPSARKSPAP